MRLGRFYGWVHGIQHHAPDKFESILSKVAAEIARNTDVPEKDRKAIEAELKAIAEQRKQPDIDLEPLLSTLARALANDGLNHELAILVGAEASLHERDNNPLC